MPRAIVSVTSVKARTVADSHECLFLDPSPDSSCPTRQASPGPMLSSGTMAVPPSTSLPVATTDTAKPDYDENGVDLSLVRYSLSLTPTQRLKAVENFMNAMASVRTASSLPASSTK
jgi:hypothetical protein